MAQVGGWRAGGCNFNPVDTHKKDSNELSLMPLVITHSQSMRAVITYVKTHMKHNVNVKECDKLTTKKSHEISALWIYKNIKDKLVGPTHKQDKDPHHSKPTHVPCTVSLTDTPE